MEAAEALKLTAQDLLEMGVVDEVVEEPLGAAHRDPDQAIRATGKAMEEALKALVGIDGETLNQRRREKFLTIGNDSLG